MAVWEALEGESAKAFAAFKMYLRMGNQRSLPKVSQELGHSSPGTVQVWSSKWNWVERVIAYEEAEFEAVEGGQMLVAVNNQNLVLDDMFTDYILLRDIWREQVTTMKDSGEPLEAKDIKMLVEARREIDSMGRRFAGLPNVIANPKPQEEKKPALPESQALVLVGGIRPGQDVDSDYNQEDVDEDDE